MITKENFLIHEWIGLGAEVVSHTDRKQVGAKGMVVDETKNTIVIEKSGEERVMPKKTAHFRFTLPSGEKFDLDGRIAIMRPEDRPKKLYKKMGE